MTEHGFIPIYKPDLSGHERQYLNECIDTGWISSSGQFIDKFEAEFASFTGTKHAITVANGTVALHLILTGLGVGPGDEVLVPAFTYIASVNAIKMCGATPVLTEVNRDNWLIDVQDMETRITCRTKAIMPVHLYSGICDMQMINDIATQNSLLVIEDAAEAFGSKLNGIHTGKMSDAAAFSFFGNKTITTGEGGMVVCKDAGLDSLLRRLKNQGVMASPERLDQRYWHDIFAYNYRMNNVTAALGLAQIERAGNTIKRKQEIAQIYHSAFDDLPLSFQSISNNIDSAHWLISFLLPKKIDREKFMVTMQEKHGVQSRPTFFCAHQMPVFKDKSASFPVAEKIAQRGVSIPSYPSMTEAEIERVISAVQDSLIGQ